MRGPIFGNPYKRNEVDAGPWERNVKERQFEPGDLDVLRRGFEPYTSDDDSQFWLADSHGNRICLADTSGGDVTITLPDPKDAMGLCYKVKRLTAGVNSLTITSESGNVEDTTTLSIAVQYTCLQLVSDGDNWWIT